MSWNRLAQLRIISLGLCFFPATALFAAGAAAPTAQQALTLTPIQPGVAFDQPAKADLDKCTIRPEKQGASTAWMLRDGSGKMLRRFADTNGDNVVDQWCYFDDGLESYRDMDSDFNGKADQYRWFQTSGTRWGIDKNEDGKIDFWKVISAPEVAEELVQAIKNRDPKRFELLLLTPSELANAGFGRAQTERMATTLKEAPAAFSKLVADQKVITPQSQFVDFYRSRPATIPLGTEGSTKDVTIHDNASALVETGDKHDQVFMGTLIAIGDTWRMIDAPTLGAVNGAIPNNSLMTNSTPENGDSTPAPGGPSDEVQKLMADLEKLDQQAEKADPSELAELTKQRAEVLQKLANAATDEDLRSDWIHQLADMYSSSVQSGTYPEGLAALDKLATDISTKDANDPVLPYVTFRKMWAEYIQSQQAKDANFGTIQEKWLADLEAFANANPKSPESAEALLQLGMSHEFAGRGEKAQEWYKRLVTDFPKSQQAIKANGALTRLNSVGKPIVFRAKDFRTGKAVDLAANRNKIVLIQYWATWYDRTKQDMDALNELYAKYGGRGFEIIGVCLDKDQTAMKTFLDQNKYRWPQVAEKDGFDGRLANEMGVMTLPLMILVDAKGNVIDDNIFVPEVEPELKQRLNPAATAQGVAPLAAPR